MSGMQRTKGASGEREAAALIRDLLGFDVRRRVRQHDGDSDLVGVPGWSIEVKRHAYATPAVIAVFWGQAVAQAGGSIPALFYRLDRRGWRVRWPLAVLLVNQRADYWTDNDWTADTTVEAWAAVVRECLQNAPERPRSDDCGWPATMAVDASDERPQEAAA